MSSHDGVDVAVTEWGFVEACGEQPDAGLFEVRADFAPAEDAFGLFSAHEAAGAVGGGVEGIGVGFSFDDESGRGHRAGDDAEHSGAGGSGAFAVNDEFAPEVGFAPGEVVVVLDVEEDLCAEVAGDVGVDELVICSGVTAHELHGCPILLAFVLVEGEPSEVGEFLRELGVQLFGNAAVVVANFRAGAAAAAMGKQGEVFAWG